MVDIILHYMYVSGLCTCTCVSPSCGVLALYSKSYIGICYMYMCDCLCTKMYGGVGRRVGRAFSGAILPPLRESGFARPAMGYDQFNSLKTQDSLDTRIAPSILGSPDFPPVIFSRKNPGGYSRTDSLHMTSVKTFSLKC